MGLMRAFTLKRTTLPTRHTTLKGRPQISLPTELISTTNTLSYTAPSIESMQQNAITTSIYSSEIDVEATPLCPPTPTTPTASSPSSRRSSSISDSTPSLTDASSISSSPTTPPTHDFTSTSSPTGYFNNINSFSKPSRNSLVTVIDDENIDPLTVVVPALPRRAPSHSKREHERLAKRRSQRVSMRIDTAAVPADGEVTSLSGGMPELVEVVEEVEVSAVAVEVAETEVETLDQLMRELVVEDEEVAYMRLHGLKRFSVGGYLEVVGETWAMEVGSDVVGA